jgi:hypothetical protein
MAKQLTKEEKEEIEAARIAEETRIAAEAAEEARYKHVLQLDFNAFTRESMPSVSPRDQLSYTQDKKTLKDITKFKEKHPELDRLLIMLRAEILRKQPKDIIKFVERDFFAERNEKSLRDALGISDTVPEVNS